MKPRFSPSRGRSCVKMADRFADISESDFHLFKNKLSERMIKQLLNSVIAKYLDFSVVTPLTNS